MRRVMMTAGLLACVLMVFACNGDTSTPALPTDTPSQPPTHTEESAMVSTPTDTPALETTITPTTPIGTPVTIRFVQMIDGATGWGIGSTTGDANHVLITQDGGSLWEDITPPEPTLGTKHAFGYFHDRHTGWVVYYPILPPGPPSSGTFYTWNTTNDGATWTQSTTHSVEFPGAPYYPPFIDFISANTGWIMLRTGGSGMSKYPVYLMKTTNGGASWTIQVNPYGGLYLQTCPKTGMDFVDASTGWVTYDWNCPYPGPRVSVTSDGGSTWTDIFLPEPTSHPGLFSSAACDSHSPTLFSSTTGVVAMSCVSSGDLTNTEDYLYVTTNGGVSWTDVPYPGGPLYALDSATMFAMGLEHHRSTDGGASWTLTSIVSWEGQFSFVTPLYAWGAVEASGSYALVKTVNGTSSWAQLNPMVGP